MRIVRRGRIAMNVKELRDYLAEFPDTAKVQVVVNNCPANFSTAWGGSDGGKKATAHKVVFMVGGNDDSA